MTENDVARPPSPPTRVRVAQALAFVALVASLIGALGPAERVRTTYAWPPAQLPEGTPKRTWYAPLFITWQRPDAISANVPCALPPNLSGSGGSGVVLATARHPTLIDGLAVRRDGNRLTFEVGDDIVERVTLPSVAPTDTDCAYRLAITADVWSLGGGPDDIARGGRLERRPVVTGLFSELDLRGAGAPSIAVTTPVHATRTTTRQSVAWSLAVLAAMAALGLVAFERRPRRPREVAGELLRQARAHARPADAAVGALLAFWWVVSPAFFDDGWVTATERMFESSRGFSHYYSAFAVNLPLDYWLEWAHHWLAQSSTSLLWSRLPAVLCLGVIWLLCRWMAVRVLGSAARLEGAPLWTLAAVFVLGAVAWGITLRPEPVTALFVTGVLACVVLFVERESTAAVALAAIFVAFALSAHPAGIVSLAAIVVVAPRLFRWLRHNSAVATAVVAAALALVSVLLFVGADLEQRRTDAQVTRTYSFSETWRDELTRYTLLRQVHYGTPLRRMTVALIALTALAFVVRRRRVRQELLDLPSSVLVAGLVLLIATPSKWPSHFGTLMGIAAVAACCEAARLREEAGRSDGWRTWPFLAVAAAALAVGWAWLVRREWNVADLRTLDWTPGFESWFPVARLAAILPLAVLAGALVLGRLRGHHGLHAIPWRVASWAAVLAVVPVLAFSAAMLVADAARTSPSWTLTRQNLQTLVREDPGCGLAQDLLVADPSSLRALPPVRAEARTTTWSPPAPAPGLPRYELGPPSAGRATATPWFALPADSQQRLVGFFLTGRPVQSTKLRLQWGRARSGEIEPLSADAIDTETGFRGNAPWRFLAAGDLPEPISEATAVRVVLDSGSGSSSAVAVTAPATYANVALADSMRDPTSRTLVYPNMLTYIPCAPLPVLRDGTVEPPDRIISWEIQFSAFSYVATTPFLGVVDLFELHERSIADTQNAPAGINVFDVDQRIPGGLEVEPTVTTTTS